MLNTFLSKNKNVKSRPDSYRDLSWKQIFYFFAVSLFSICAVNSMAQNLVPNPSFETYSPCPISPDLIANATGWSMPTSGTSDYFNACATFASAVDVPNNGFGSQAANTGVGYAGLYNVEMLCDYREYIRVQLTSPLVIGLSYTASMYASLAEESDYASNNIGMFFSTSASVSTTNLPCTAPNTGVISPAVIPQVNSAAVITNIAGWTLISGTFTATTAAQYLYIGNFYNTPSTTTNPGPGSGGTGAAYYYIDDVSVVLAAALPIEFISFTSYCKDARVVLNWSTATETNNDYFTIERSADGINWEVVGTVDGAGNSSTIHNYEFTNSSPEVGGGREGALYYRLKQTNYDGKFEYFDPVVVEACTDLSVFPSPASNELSIQFFSESDDIITFEVYDVIGKLIISKSVFISEGSNHFTLDISGVAGGMYMLKVKSSCNPVEANQKFIKQ